MQEAFALSTPNTTSDVDSINPLPKDPKDTYSFENIKSRISKISKQWKDEKALTDERRELRYLNINVQEERRTGRLKPHEIYIPIRVIDDNIRKEAPQYIAYLTTSRNSAIFKPKQNTQLPMQVIESSFTKMVRFPGWELPFFRNLDGTQMHGWAAVEIVFDGDKPGHFSIEDIAHENLWFSVDLEHAQRAPSLVRNCKVTKDELMKFRDVNEDEVNNLFANIDNDTNHLYATVEVQKVFYRNEVDGLIYVCWLSYDKSKTFVRPPKPLWLGKVFIVRDSITNQPQTDIMGKPMTVKIYETQYPVEVLPYIVSENGRITAVKGRCFLDEYIQESCGSLVSSIVNSWHLASQIMASPSNPVSGGSAEETDIIIKTGKIYSEPLTFFHMPYPDTGGLGVVESLLTRNQAETSNVNFAVNNREDSRKTAKEIGAAQSQAALLSGVQVTLYSIFLRNVWTRCWSIAKSQLEQGLLPNVDIDPNYIFLDYDIYSAGDSEVITREETLQKFQQAWGVYQNTPAAPIILKTITDLAFPMYAEEINKALDAGSPSGIIAAMTHTIAGFVQQFGNSIDPADLQKLEQIIQEGGQYLQAQQPQGKNTNAPKPAGANPKQITAGQATPTQQPATEQAGISAVGATG